MKTDVDGDSLNILEASLIANAMHAICVHLLKPGNDQRDNEDYLRWFNLTDEVIAKAYSYPKDPTLTPGEIVSIIKEHWDEDHIDLDYERIMYAGGVLIDLINRFTQIDKVERSFLRHINRQYRKEQNDG